MLREQIALAAMSLRDGRRTALGGRATETFRSRISWNEILHSQFDRFDTRTNRDDIARANINTKGLSIDAD